MRGMANHSSLLYHQICTTNFVRVLSPIIQLPMLELGFGLHFPCLRLLDEAFHILFHLAARLPLMKSRLLKVQHLKSILKKNLSGLQEVVKKSISFLFL